MQQKLASRGTNEKRLVSAMIHEHIVDVARPVCERHPNDTCGQIAGKIVLAVAENLHTDDRLKGKEKLFPTEQQAITKRLKKLWPLIQQNKIYTVN